MMPQVYRFFDIKKRGELPKVPKALGANETAATTRVELRQGIFHRRKAPSSCNGRRIGEAHRKLGANVIVISLLQLKNTRSGYLEVVNFHVIDDRAVAQKATRRQ